MLAQIISTFTVLYEIEKARRLQILGETKYFYIHTCTCIHVHMY